ncbi:hypothetical protein BKA64DRAFT_767993 [Cadophora sp. MPI-SDFR-AT-0126]|nr:hypothetical protein BKA64DRAFT_767993 [Leotiomycetes sp. MPI-SDFR-AT-0126]
MMLLSLDDGFKVGAAVAIIVHLFGPVAAGDSASVSAKGCSFTIISSGTFVCPAGQLDDGQIRLNGTQEVSTFYINNGQITDSKGRGCIITEAPSTQIQCDEGKTAAQGFSIDSNNILSWKGRSQFSACPATDTEYNIYINPNFGQAKCVGIQLIAGGCSVSEPTTSSTVSCAIQTITETCTVTATEQVITTSTSTMWLTLKDLITSVWTMPCPTTASSSSSTSSYHYTTSTMSPTGNGTACHKCTRIHSYPLTNTASSGGTSPTSAIGISSVEESASPSLALVV